jgi:hypothetical protein
MQDCYIPPYFGATDKTLNVDLNRINMHQTPITAYLAPKSFVNQAAAELKGVQAVHGRLVIAGGPPQTSYWAQNTWLEPRTFRIRSITEGAKALRAIQRNWIMYSFRWHRRATLIQEKLPHGPCDSRNLSHKARWDPGPCWRPTSFWRQHDVQAPFLTERCGLWKANRGRRAGPT